VTAIIMKVEDCCASVEFTNGVTRVFTSLGPMLRPSPHRLVHKRPANNGGGFGGSIAFGAQGSAETAISRYYQRGPLPLGG
jgi:hypothetical protein